ncbi:hypothetical protein [Bradyrhizobium lupini]|uniref:hypothetical protein n=1 Tax=Rhizobium lupini TaxID=136996 RepID=UPI0034C65135
MTRDNSIWRVPLMRDGVGKVGRFSWFFATSGPDGLTVDQKKGGSLSRMIPSATFSYWRQTAKRSACIQSCAGGSCTNVILDAALGTLLITESSTGSVLMADLAHLHRNSPAGVARWCGILLRAGPPHQDAGMSLVDNWLASCRENVIGDEWMAFVCGDLKPEPVNRTAWKRKRRIRKAGSGSARNGPPPTCRYWSGGSRYRFPQMQND